MDLANRRVRTADWVLEGAARPLSWSGLALLVLALVETTAHAAVAISAIEFQNRVDRSEILVRGSAPITFERTDLSENQQIVLDLKQARFVGNASRSLDTSSFDSAVKLINPYQLGGESRLVIQLRSLAAVEVTPSGNDLVIRVANTGSGQVAGDASGNASVSNTPDLVAGASAEASAPSADATSESAAASKKVGLGDLTNKNLEDFLTNRGAQNFIGKQVTLQVKDMELTDVFRLISEASGFNILLGGEVKGTVTLSLIDVPWDQALDLILRTQSLGAERSGNVLRVTTLANLTREKQAELQAKQASEASAVRVTRIFPVSFARPGELLPILSRFGSAPVAGDPSSSIIQVDSRTNSLIIRDTVENVEKMRKLIEILDSQTPQVLIEAKVVEASEGFSRTLNGSLGLGTRGSRDGGAYQWVGIANNFSSSVDPTFSVAGIGGAPAVVNGAPPAPANNLPGFGTGIFPRILRNTARIGAVLQIGEQENKIRIISSPRTVVLNRQTASIVQSTPTVLTQTNNVQGVIQNIPVVTQANLRLQATPTVTNDGSVLLDLDISRDVPIQLSGGQGSAVANRNIRSNVLVESGSTLVIGGIYTSDVSEASGGVPVLRDIPVLGWLFGNRSSTETHQELFIFITPQILNEKAAGLTG